MSAAPRTPSRHLPASTPFPLASLFNRERRAEGVFPFSAKRSRWYLLGRNALWHGLRALHLEEGDEVLIPAYNSGAEVEAVIAAGLTPRFFQVGTDLRPRMRDMELLTSDRTRVLLVIHYFGFPQPMAYLTRFAERHRLLLIEDCATALFSCDDGEPLGTTGVFSLFSPRKTLPLSFGGLLVVNDPDIELPSKPEEPSPTWGLEQVPSQMADGLEMHHPRAMRLLRGVARRFADGNGRHDGAAVEDEGLDLTTINVGASVAIRELALRADPAAVVRERRQNYRFLGALLPVESQLAPELPPGVCPLFFPFLVSDPAAMIQMMRERGVDLYPYWSKPHPAIPREGFMEVGHLRKHLLALPVYQGLSVEDVEYVAEAVLSCALRN
jgi:perosamine synthetase